MNEHLIAMRRRQRAFGAIAIFLAILALVAITTGVLLYNERETVPSVIVENRAAETASSSSPVPLQASTTQLVSLEGSTISNAISATASAASSADSQGLDQNRSSLHLDSAGNTMLLTDPAGRQTGDDTTTGNVVQQIPNSEFSSQAITDIEYPNSQPPADYFLDVHNPMPGTYMLTLVAGQGSVTYDVTMATFSSDGSRQSTEELRGSVVDGSKRLFQIDFRPSEQARSTIELIN